MQPGLRDGGSFADLREGEGPQGEALGDGPLAFDGGVGKLSYNDIDRAETRKRWAYMAGISDEKTKYPDRHRGYTPKPKIPSGLKRGGQPGPHMWARKDIGDLTLLTLASYYCADSQRACYNWVF